MLNSDILDYMWDFLDIPNSLNIVKSCSEYNKKYKSKFYEKLKKIPKYSNIEYLSSCKQPSIDYIKLLKPVSRDITPIVMDNIAHNGNLELLKMIVSKYYYQYGIVLNEYRYIKITSIAISANQPEIVKWCIPKLNNSKLFDGFTFCITNNRYRFAGLFLSSYIYKVDKICLFFFTVGCICTSISTASVLRDTFRGIKILFNMI